MKTRIFTLIAGLCLALTVAAQDHISERVYLSTDKAAYVAGDMVWGSVFCLDARTGLLSDFSGIAYVELHSSEGLVQTGKAALTKGRGACNIKLQNTLPTGNYKLVAYTTVNRNEDFFDCDKDAKIISIFNTLSTEKLEGGVEIVTDEDYLSTKTAPFKTSGKLEIKPGTAEGGILPLSIANSGLLPVSLSVSIYHKDAILPVQSTNVIDFASRVKSERTTSYTIRYTPEYEGEIIRAKVAGMAQSDIASLKGKTVYISTPGEGSDMYSADLDAEGNVEFFTCNIYGEKDMVMEIEGLEPGVTCHMETISPFYNPSLTTAPMLRMAKCLDSSLRARNAGMKMEYETRTDTLLTYLPTGSTSLLNEEYKEYILDDYTRFPLMEEVITEYVNEMQIRNNGKGGKEIRILMDDVEGGSYFASGTTLMMVDGVPVLDQQKIIDYDPLLVKRINIFPNSYSIGSRSYSGIANFETYKRNLPAISFADNVRIVSFKGTSYPVEYSCLDLPEGTGDYRQTIYWNPLTDIPAEGEASLQCRIPSYSGEFEIVVEGFSTDGKPICLHHSIKL